MNNSLAKKLRRIAAEELALRLRGVVERHFTLR